MFRRLMSHHLLWLVYHSGTKHSPQTTRNPSRIAPPIKRSFRIAAKRLEFTTSPRIKKHNVFYHRKTRLIKSNPPKMRNIEELKRTISNHFHCQLSVILVFASRFVVAVKTRYGPCRPWLGSSHGWEQIMDGTINCARNSARKTQLVVIWCYMILQYQ